MSRFQLFLLFNLFLAGCNTTNPNPPAVTAPPPGWSAAPPITAAPPMPAPSGCSSCAGSNPVVNAPRYSPPIPAAPPLTSVTPGLSIGFPVSAPPAHGPIQVAFKPIGSPVESAKLGVVQADETPAIPVPPTDAPEARTTGNSK